MKKWWIRRMGYFRDQEGILHRYFNEQGNWNSHLEKTKEVIEKTVSAIQNKSSVLVLGSGWLLDVPIEFLCNVFEKVYLVDIHHPVEIRKKNSKHKNIVWVEQDITGVSQQIYRLAGKRKSNLAKDLKNLKISPPNFKFEADFIISVNILSQIDELVVHYLKRSNKIDSDVITEFRKRIQEKHLLYLQKRNSLLVTDIEEVSYDRDMELKESNPIIFTKLPEENKTEEWQWRFDTQMTYRRNFITFRNVNAYRFIP